MVPKRRGPRWSPSEGRGGGPKAVKALLVPPLWGKGLRRFGNTATEAPAAMRRGPRWTRINEGPRTRPRVPWWS